MAKALTGRVQQLSVNAEFPPISEGYPYTPVYPPGSSRVVLTGN
ncbi:MAG: hypothetical protein ACLP7P_13020 [Rhodomicrobium sp.]